MQLVEMGASRPPCSVAEREIADAVARRFADAGLSPALERIRAPTSPTWAPLLRALLRVWAVACLTAGWPLVCVGLAGAAVLGGVPAIAGLLRSVPFLGGTGHNVVAVRRGADASARPIVVAAHLDTHPTGGAPLTRTHAFVSAASGAFALLAGIAARPATGWRIGAALVAAESVATLAWLARGELAGFIDSPDDNTSGLLALVRIAVLAAEGTSHRDVWLVATSGGTSGSYGMRTFLRRRTDLKPAWVVEIDALGTGEVTASPHAARFPRPGTPASLIRAIAAAARASGDPLTVRRVRRPHSDARTALRMRTAAITVTGGLRAARGGHGPDVANAERAARIVDALARSDDGRSDADQSQS